MVACPKCGKRTATTLRDVGRDEVVFCPCGYRQAPSLAKTGVAELEQAIDALFGRRQG